MIESTKFSNCLSGDTAFYKQTNQVTIENELRSKELMPTSYTYETESNVLRNAKKILFFPFLLIHSLAGRLILPASASGIFSKSSKEKADELRSSFTAYGAFNISLLEYKPGAFQRSWNAGWRFKRITVEVDGYKIDAAIMGKENTLNNGKWVLASHGNGEFYEDKLRPPRSEEINPHDLDPDKKDNNDFQQLLIGLESNAVVFNYSGVGASSGPPNKQAMVKAYRAMLRFLEDKEHGVGATEIIGYGHSMGGGVQGEALKNHQLQEGINYGFVKSKTFSSVAAVASKKCSLGWLVKLLGWDMDSVESSKVLQAPEIIIQRAEKTPQQNLDQGEYGAFSNSNPILSDGVIPKDASLAKALLEDNSINKINKQFLETRFGHNEGIEKPKILAQKIRAFFEQQWETQKKQDENLADSA